MAMLETDKSYFVTVDTSFDRMFNSLKRFPQLCGAVKCHAFAGDDQ